jgi:hypothetical protein
MKNLLKKLFKKELKNITFTIQDWCDFSGANYENAIVILEESISKQKKYNAEINFEDYKKNKEVINKIKELVEAIKKEYNSKSILELSISYQGPIKIKGYDFS